MTSLQSSSFAHSDMALSQAVSAADLEGCLRALAMGASPDAHLYLAINRGFEPIALALLAAGANPNAACGPGGYMPALHYACHINKPSIALALLRFGARVDAPCAYGGQALAYSVGRSPNAEIARALLAAGADPNHADHQGARALFNCALKRPGASQAESLLVAQLLIDAGADPLAADLSGSTARSQATLFGNHDLIALIDAALERRALDDLLTREGLAPNPAFSL